jgi:CO/xanthine dehydrogenase FAD-binding subunit
MITEYHRPDTLTEALELITRTDVFTVPIGGGAFLNTPSERPVAVVDLQSLGLNTIQIKGNKLEIGATATLQQLGDSDVEPALKSAIRHEATYNIRQIATIAGKLVSANGRSPLATVMLALDAELYILPNEHEIGLGSFLLLRDKRSSNYLISHIKIHNHVNLGYEYVARTPADLPIVSVAVAHWKSGRTRVVLGGYGDVPILAMDGPDSEGAVSAAQNAFREAGDQWASAAYRCDVAGTLTARCLKLLQI